MHSLPPARHMMALLFDIKYANNQWGRSSAGRASRSQCEGREFDPPRLHQLTVPPSPKASPKPPSSGLFHWFSLPPAALSSTAGDGRYVSFKNFARLRITLAVLNGATVTGGTITLKQASA